jgi:hypothetical protein
VTTVAGVPEAGDGPAGPLLPALAENDRPVLPIGLWLISLLLVVSGGVLILSATGTRVPGLTGGFLGLADSEPGRLFVGIVAAGQIASGIGLLLRSRPAWVLATILIGLGLLVEILDYLRGDFHAIRLGLFVAMAFYLNQVQVRAVFVRQADVTSGPGS